MLAGSRLLVSFVQTDGGIGQDGPPNGDYDHHDCKKLLACFLPSFPSAAAVASNEDWPGLPTSLVLDVG